MFEHSKIHMLIEQLDEMRAEHMTMVQRDEADISKSLEKYKSQVGNYLVA